ncbi:MAG TPA: SCO2322 family protein [Nocardioidaceae bacterium]|nr:SCO2322 family protein [Nocardioidaceae bacterium]
MASTLPRRVAGTISSLLLAAFAVAALAGPAHAEDGYRYWHYFHLDGSTWAFSEVGAAEHQPEDGDVEGFRFGTSTMSQPLEPRADLDEIDFDTVCADTEATEGEKRVAVLIDYGVDEGQGTPPDPRAECAAAAEDASTQQILGQVADVRVEGGMTCALDGYPASGCGDPVADADVPTDEEPVAFALAADSEADSDADGTSGAADDSGALSPWLVAVAALVLLLVIAAVVTARRRKAA